MIDRCHSLHGKIQILQITHLWKAQLSKTALMLTKIMNACLFVSMTILI